MCFGVDELHTRGESFFWKQGQAEDRKNPGVKASQAGMGRVSN